MEEDGNQWHDPLLLTDVSWQNQSSSSHSHSHCKFFQFHFSLSSQIFSCTFSHFLISHSFISLQKIRLLCPAIICKLLLWLIKVHMRVMWLRSLYLFDSFFFAFSAKPCFRIVRKIPFLCCFIGITFLTLYLLSSAHSSKF